MVKRIGTQRKKTRRILAVPKKLKGKLRISRFLQTFKVGDNVVLKAYPAVHKGLYGRRFHGKTGSVVRVNNKTCEVKIVDKHKIKLVIVRPVHLMKVQSGTQNN